MTSDPSLSQERPYLSLAQIAAELELSPRTVGRYRAEYAPYFHPYEPAGSNRGLRPEALELIKVIHSLKTHRAHWTEIKQELETRFGTKSPISTLPASKSFHKSLDSLRQSHQLMSAELRLLFAEVNQRLDKLEDSVKTLQSQLRSIPRTTEERTHRETIPSMVGPAGERSPRLILKPRGKSSDTADLFPEINDPPPPDQLF